MINVQNISSKLASLPDQALKQYAEMHKEDPYVFSLALSESNRRKQMRSQGQQAMPQPRVVDKELEEMDMRLPEDLGIARIPIDMNMASGGIVAFDDGGYVPRYKEKGLVEAPSKEVLRKAIIDEATAQGVDPALALQISGVESSMDPSARPIDPKTGKPRSSAKSLFQVIDKTYSDFGGDPKKRSDPFENIRVGVKSLAYTQDSLSKQLGRQPDAAEMYTGHFLGAETGGKMLQADPKMSVKDFLKNTDPKNADEIIKANPEVLSGKKVGDVFAWTQKKMAPVLTAMVPAGQAIAQTEMAASAPAQTASQATSIGPATKWSDLVPSWMIPPEKPVAPKTGPSATLSGMGRALVTPEGVGRAATGLVEDSALSMAGAPADLAPTSKIPLLRGLGAGAEYLRSKFAPSAATDVGTTPYLKRKATEAGLRPEDSTDPNMRAIQTSGEIAGSIFHPVDAVRSLAGSAAKAFRGARADLDAEKVSAGLKAIADKKDAAVATAKEVAAAAAEKIKNIRLGTDVTPPAKMAPPLTPQGPTFPVSPEAMRLKQQAADAAAARAKPAPEAPKGLEALAADKAAAQEAARVAARLEAEAVEARAAAEGKATGATPATPTRVKPPNVPQNILDKANAAKAVPKGASVATREGRIVASPGQIVARDANKEFPSIGSEDSGEDYQPDTSRGYPAPSESDKPINYDEGVGRRDAGYGTEKQIIAAAKDAVPKSEDTDGWSKNDWLQFGLALMAGKSSNALTNVGEAGLSLLASKQARAAEKNKLDLYKSVHAEKPGQSIQIAERLMAADKNLSFEDALAKATALTGGATKEALSDTKAEQTRIQNLKNFNTAKDKLDEKYSPLLMSGNSPTSKGMREKYEADLQALREIHSIPASIGPVATAASASGWGVPQKQ